MTAIGVSTIAAAAAPVPLRRRRRLPARHIAIDRQHARPRARRRRQKLTCTVQLWLTATLAPTQLSVSLKSPGRHNLLTVSAAFPVFVTVMVCAALAVPTACVAKRQTRRAQRHRRRAPDVLAVSSGISQMPRPYVAARSSPSRPSPVGITAAAASSTTGAFGSPAPYTLQQFAVAQVVTCVGYIHPRIHRHIHRVRVVRIDHHAVRRRIRQIAR